MEDTYKGQVDNPLSLNRYTYTHNNPLRYVDPTGHAAATGAGAFFGGNHADLVLSWGEKAVTYADAHKLDYDDAVDAIVPAELKQEVHEVVYQIGATRTQRTAGDMPDLGLGAAGAGAAAGAIKKSGNTAKTQPTVQSSKIQNNNQNWVRMTTKEATAAAKKHGYEPTGQYAKNKEMIFYNKKTKTYISQDIGSGDGSGPHNGGIWKMSKTLEGINRKETRLGTFDANLYRIGD